MKLTEYKYKRCHYFKDEQGRLQSEYKSWHPNGQQREISHYRDDKRHGECKAWHENGRLNMQRHYKDDKYHGECKLWHRNGQQWVISHFRDDERHGECKYWSHSGELIVHTFDIDGKEIIDFLENPELYPTTHEEKTMFVLKYGNAPFITTLEDK